MATSPLHLSLPNYVQGGSQSPIDTSPVASTTNVSTAQILLERSDIDKSLKSLENLVSLLYDYAQLWQNLVTMDKKLVKAFKDAGSLKRSTTGVDGLEWPAQVFMNSSSIFDAVSEVDSKYSKLVEREYENCTQELKKWLKKLKKEDKALDEYTAAANAKIKAAGMAYEKKSKKGITSSPSVPSLDSYSTLLSSLTSAVNNAKHQHMLFTSSRHVSVLYTASGSVGRVADAQWMKTCELLRKAAINVGPLGEGRSYVESGWRGGPVADLPLNLPVNAATGSINGLEAQQITANDNAPNPLINSPPTPAPGRPIMPTGSNQASSSAAPTLRSAPTLSTNYLDEVTQELRTSLALPEPSKTENKGTTQRQKNPDTKGKDIKQSEEPLGLRTEKKPETSTKEIKPTQMDETSSPTVPSSNHTTHSTTTTDTNITNSSRTTQSTNTSAKDTATISSYASKASIEEKTTQTPLPPPPEETAVFEPRHTLARTPLNTEPKDKGEKSHTLKDSIATPIPAPNGQTPASSKDPEVVTNYFPLVNKDKIDKNEPQAAISSPKQPIRSNSSYPQGAVPQSPPQLPHAPMSFAGRPVGRTLSIDSTTSNGSHVAAMRDRYNTGSPPLPNPHVSMRPGEIYIPRDREVGRVSDMASRFTPIDGPPRIPSSQPRENRNPRPSYAPQSPSARWLADAPSPLGDTLPIRTPISRDSIDEFGTSFSSMPVKARDTMPNPDRRHQPMSGAQSQTMGPAGALSTPYNLQITELELRQREMELEIQRQRLQLAKDREALFNQERAYQEDTDHSDYASGREARGHARYSRNIDANRGGYGDLYERAGPRDGYDTPNRDPYGVTNQYGYERDRGRYEPNLGSSQMPVEAVGPSSYRNRAYTADSRPSDSPQRSHVDLSSGLGVLGLGLPPGAGPSARLGTPSRESLPLAGPSTQNLGPPSIPTAEGSPATNGPSPRRSADAISPGPGTSSAKGKEKEKGGTWIGRGLKRFSMPLDAKPNS